MNIIKAIEVAQKKKQERWYEYLYWCIDVHGVILTPTYSLMNVNAKFYPYAFETLQLLSRYKENKLILWTSSYKAIANNLIDSFDKDNIIFTYLNSNPDYKLTDLCDFTSKFYFDILLDDKAGFEGESDWKLIYDYLTGIYK